MTWANWQAWLQWLLVLSVFLTLWLVWAMARNMQQMRAGLGDAGVVMRQAPARTRKELEERYVAGAINREVYDRWKERLK